VAAAGQLRAARRDDSGIAARLVSASLRWSVDEAFTWLDLAYAHMHKRDVGLYLVRRDPILRNFVTRRASAN
jgi:hypothetical protein